MSVRFILGRAGTGKSRLCIHEAAAALRAGGDEPLVLLVPEQATYQIERAMVTTEQIAGFARLRILSFDRLGFGLLGSPGAGRELSPLGRQIILTRLLAEAAPRLRILGACAHQPGMAARIGAEITEFYQADLTPEAIRQTARQLSDQRSGKQAALKLQDLADLFEQYQEFLAARNSQILDTDSILSKARQRVQQAPFLRGGRVWVDGFSGFTLQEMALLREVTKTATETKIALCLDAAVFDPSVRDADALDPYSVFAPTEQTYVQLANMLQKSGQKIDPPILLTEAKRFEKAPALGHLEKHFLSPQKAAPIPAGDSIRIAALPDVRAECLWTARQIQALVRDRGLRYRQIAVVAPDMETYEHPLNWALSRTGVPYFLDRPRPLRMHPIADLITCALQAVCGRYGPEDMTAYLKTHLAGANAEQADLLDNYCKAYGAEGSDWTQKAAWDFAGAEILETDQAAIDALRRKVIEPLEQLRQGLKPGEEIAPESFVAALWAFLERLSIRDVLAKWAADDPSDQRFGHRQFWDKLTGLCDEICRTDAGNMHPAQQYADFLDGGFNELTVKRIPPALDQVLVGAIERSRHPEIGAIFLMGATAKLFPVPVRNDSLFNADDRRLLESLEFEAVRSIETQLIGRQYLAYIALSRADRRIFLMRPAADDNGSPIQPWTGLEVLSRLFTDLQTEYPAGGPERIEQVHSADELAGFLTAQLGRDSTASNDEKALAAALLDEADRQKHFDTAFVRSALNWQNAATLDASLARQMRPDPPAFSISRLEMFAACPYKFFASYILRLQKRRQTRMEPIDFGSFYHHVLDEIFKQMQRDQNDWRKISDPALTDLCRCVIERVCLADTVVQGCRRHSAHQGFVIAEMCANILELVLNLRRMICAGAFTPADTEIRFGMKDQPPLMVTGPDGRQVLLHGVMDRLDLAQTDDGAAAVVFDYKRTAKSFSWAKWFHGLGLQLPVYLLAAQSTKKATRAVGAFFIPIETPTQSQSLSNLKKDEEKFPHKAKGLFNGEVSERLDAGASQWSRYYTFAVNKDGSPYSNFNNSSAVRPEQLDKTLKQTRQIVLNLAGRIGTGEIAAAPYRLGRQSPCGFCEYRPVCKFDWQINEYRPLEAMDKQQALDKLEGGNG